MFGNLLNPKNGLMITLSWITDCLFLSMLWLLLSVFILPLGPATAALYDTAFHTYRKGEERVYARFFRSFKKNLRVGIPAGLLAAAMGALGFRTWNYIAAAVGETPAGYALLWGFFVLLLLLIGMTAFLFAVLSRFETTLPGLFSNCFFISMANLPRTAALSLIGAVSIWFCRWFWWPVIFIPCLSAIVASFFIEPAFAPFLPEEEEKNN